MAFPGEIGWIGKACPEHPTITLRTKILQSAAGFFVGTQCPECSKMDPSPNSRETHYYPSRDAVEQAIDDGTLRFRDTGHHPGPFTVEE
jgi:hypothetical protein